MYSLFLFFCQSIDQYLISELNVLIPIRTLSFCSSSATQQCQQTLQKKQFRLTNSNAGSIFSSISSLFSPIQNRSAIFCRIFELMARIKKQRKKKKKKKYKHKGRGYFSANDYNNILYDNFRHGRRRQRGGFLNWSDLLTLAGIPSTRQLNIWTR